LKNGGRWSQKKYREGKKGNEGGTRGTHATFMSEIRYDLKVVPGNSKASEKKKQGVKGFIREIGG